MTMLRTESRGACHCPVNPFSRPRLNLKAWAVNLSCVPSVDAETLPKSVFDGANWEEPARLS